MKFVLEIELGNAAMLTYQDIAWSLSELMARAHMADDANEPYAKEGNPVWDANGNRVGHWAIEE